LIKRASSIRVLPPIRANGIDTKITGKVNDQGIKSFLWYLKQLPLTTITLHIKAIIGTKL
jgi:hypothetical protein